MVFNYVYTMFGLYSFSSELSSFFVSKKKVKSSKVLPHDYFHSTIVDVNSIQKLFFVIIINLVILVVDNLKWSHVS